ncbi:MAG: helix-turn-helix domain-containing protein [Pirellulales bacterium]
MRFPREEPAAGERPEVFVSEILTGLGVRPAGSTQRMFHHQWGAILITNGGYRVGADPRRAFDAAAGDLVLMKPETEHVWTTATHPQGSREGLRAYWALFRPPPRLELLLQYPEVQPHYAVVHVSAAATLRRMVRCFKEMLALGNSQLPARTELQFNLLEQALLWCANDQRARIGTADRRVAKVIEYMAANLAMPLTIDDLCGVAGVSRSQLAVVFQRETRQTPMRYLERLRIERAMQLLRLATPTLDELAADVGFCDAKHFTRRFKLLVGMPPSEYRRSQRAETRPTT